MPLPTPTGAAGRAGLEALLAAPEKSLLGLDFDGTLSPIVEDPDSARAHPDIPPVLARLAPRLGRLAVVTGRPALLAVEYAALADIPGLTVLGHYGLERWENGRLVAPDDDPAVDAARVRLPELLTGLGLADAHVEDKGRSVAVHVRRLADPTAAYARVREPLVALAAELGLVAEPGRLVVELRPAGMDKGAAMRTLAAEVADGPGLAMAGFVGDDLGDLAAFEAVSALRRDGTPGLLVCSGSAEVTELAALADLVVDGPEGVAELLGGLADALGE